ncbi:MAG TPA: TMEM175 family protein [Acidimicrobiales bacterium]|nr:TMEM175 family protein [Acidimicrobiales bacterium]
MSKEDEVPTTEEKPGLRRTARLEAFSDGVFAIAITLLVLDLAIPETRQSEKDLLHAVRDQWPGYLGYIVSFSTVGALWLGHNAITDYLSRADATLLRVNLLLLLFVSFLPFPTRLVSEYITVDHAERVAVTFYGLTLLISGVLLSLLWRYALHAQLVRPDANDEEISLLTHRLTPGLAGYSVLIVVGLFAPVAAVVGYFVIALFFLLPVHLRPRRHRRS